MPNRAARRFYIAAAGVTSGTTLHNAVALSLGHHRFEDLLLDLGVFGAGALAIVALADRPFFVPCATLAGVALGAAVPEYAIPIAAVATGGGLIVATLKRLSARREAPTGLPRRD